VNIAVLDQLAAEARPRLLAIAYRMVGSMSDAEDVVQDALVKAQRADLDDVASPIAYLTAITTRTAIDHLRSARVRRETYVGPWLPEPVLQDPAPDASANAVLADSLSMAFLVLLESLSPEERAALLLHDVFGYSHAEVARTLDRTEAASRQLLRRARQRIEADRPRFDARLDQRDALVRRFIAACEGGDMDSFLQLLTEGATYVADGGSAVKAARHPIRGPVRIARLLAALMTRGRERRTFTIVRLNAQPAIAVFDGAQLTGAVLIDPGADDRIDVIRWVRNPTKLARLRARFDADERLDRASGDHTGGA
jgi:RNA polymerase sigma-70 factor (ECF subfamily)